MTKRAYRLLFLLVPTLTFAEPLQVEFRTSDNIRVYGDLYESDEGKSAPIILLFHQAGGDARGEYSGIAARLVDVGYNVLAVDQRSGGDRFGGTNRTVAELQGREFAYCDVYPDLEAALSFVREQNFGGPLAAWGSSYSAALVFQLAARNPTEVDAVLGFSPASGKPLADCDPGDFLDAITVPALALRPQREFEIDSVREQMRKFEQAGVRTYVANPGVHGSSMLDPSRVQAPVDDTWSVVLTFLGESVATP